MRPFPFLFGVLLLSIVSAAGKSMEIPEENARIELPDDWTWQTPPGLAFLAQAPDEKALITGRILPNRGQARVDQSFFLEAIKKARQDKAQRDHGSLIIVEAGTATINGVPASYIHTEEPQPDGRTGYSRDYLIAANDKFYAFATEADDPFTDNKLNEIIGTFRFAYKPSLPDVERHFHRRLLQVSGITACVIFLVGFLVWLVIQWRKTSQSDTR